MAATKCKFKLGQVVYWNGLIYCGYVKVVGIGANKDGDPFCEVEYEYRKFHTLADRLRPLTAQEKGRS